MKKIFSILAGAASVILVSCVNDLNTLPLNPTDTTSETAYTADENSYLTGLSRIYFQFVSCDLKDLQLTDGGASELIRAFWSLNEVSSDAAKCAWNGDAWVAAINTNTWSDADNDAAYAVYVRTMQGVAYVNEFIRQTTESKLSDRGCSDAVKQKVAAMRAEARFLRAYFYWMAMDVFGSVPFTTEESPFGAVNPVPATRQEVFNFIVSELTDLGSDASDMPAARSNYPRADKGSALGLLARVYLNAEVYSGTPMWNEAKATCERIFSMGYDACSNYADLFRGDNGQNPDALKEILWGVDYNAEQTQSWGGTTLLTFATIASDDVTDTSHPNGVNGGWGGMRVPYDYVQKYFGVTGQDYSTGDYTIADKRGQMFYIVGRTENIEDLSKFLQGWTCFKYNNIPHDQTAEQFNETAKVKGYSDVDFPMIRLGEIILIYAEACMHTNNAASALPYLKKLSDRAGVAAPTTITQDFLVAERARELLWEGHRRTDLIRYGLFTSDSFLWPWKGGAMLGQGFSSHMNIFAIPSSELASNPELKQNPGYGTQK
ncbi:MAG: RagB/SusD family nutrient uptake outer membrane protein [Bacteroidota bacterium]|nr:RagB/SusD family nutrient uptake outer membrane protein [Bacteroidota bacterium]